MRPAARALAALQLTLPAVAGAQIPAGAEFRVSAYTTGYQYVRTGAAALAGDGRFVIVWESEGRDGSGFAAMGQRFAANGMRTGAEFQLNTHTTNHQYSAAVGMNAAGRFVVAWQSYAQDGFEAGVFARPFGRDGLPAGAELQANSYTTGIQSRASVGVDGAGGSVVAWRSAGVAGQDGDASGIFAQRLAAGGERLGSEFRVNSYTTGYQNRPDVARAPDGAFVVVWQSHDQEGPGSAYGIYAQRYASDGSPRGAEFRVNTYTTGNQTRPSVGIDRSGRFVVAWTEYASRPDDVTLSIRAQRYEASGAPAGAEFRVNSVTAGNQYWPQVAVAADGGRFLVAYAGDDDGAGAGVFARRFEADGTAMAVTFQVNSHTTGNQYGINAAADPAGNFVVAWNSDGQDGSSTGVYARRFGGLVPASLRVDTSSGGSSDGNSVWEPNETVDIRPAWHNVTGAAQAFTGVLGGIQAPGGVTAAVTDGSADYGSLADGVVGECVAAQCYAASASMGARPATHLDVAALETIAPPVLGQQKTWLLHLGDSFADVPRANAFYRFIETLLHHAITGGCTSTQYCPASHTSREQMAVFVLLAREGPSFVPPACGTPVFADVPAASPFCRWIEELARRGVVSGCGGGNYCPTSSVTREQMAVFVLRTLDGSLSPPACVPPNLYADVPETSAFCRWIEELTNRGVVTGCGGGNYCPTSSVTREQMGVFISVTFGLALYVP
jgi:hypothetical protein